MRTLLVANRGEIALRVFRSAADLGITTVAIHTDLDVDAPHVRAADRVVRVESYLDIEAVVAAARSVDADAIHPGYGFLSERAEFVRAVEAAGITFVGPSAEVMERMGRKDAAREIAVAAGVPVVPTGDPLSFGDRVAREERAGVSRFPVLVKAAAGGGGKGMRIVRSAEEYDEAVAAAKREAAAAFGDDTILVEKYVEHGRHIEVQVLGDSHGKVIHLGTRDCSAQRRHQKVVEEAPAPDLDPHLRHRIHQAAVDLARRVGYVNAGTVEFLLDAETGEFYFLEMNTRLQVEHPVTELVCGGVDLVKHQLWIAAGEELGLDAGGSGPVGHAIEARIYAEDSFNGFLPQAGTTSIVRWPSGRSRYARSSLAGYSTTESELADARTPQITVRVDHALEPNQVVSTAYDPMLGKVIVHAPDREAARRALVAALDDTAILGLTTNTGFVRALAASDEFRDAAIDTAWLDRHGLEAPDRDIPRVFVAWIQAMLHAVQDTGHPFRADGWRAGADPAPILVELDRTVVVDRARGRVDDHEVRQLSAENHVAVLIIDGRREQAVVNVQPHIVEVVHRGQRFVFERPDVFGDQALAAGDGIITAPMPGTVIDVRVEEGGTVEEGDVLGVLEAMKMELALKAPFAGTVTTVGATKADRVSLGATLFVVEATE